MRSCPRERQRPSSAGATEVRASDAIRKMGCNNSSSYTVVSHTYQAEWASWRADLRYSPTCGAGWLRIVAYSGVGVGFSDSAWTGGPSVYDIGRLPGTTWTAWWTQPGTGRCAVAVSSTFTAGPLVLLRLLRPLVRREDGARPPRRAPPSGTRLRKSSAWRVDHRDPLREPSTACKGLCSEQRLLITLAFAKPA